MKSFLKKHLWLLISIVIAIASIAVVLLSELADKEYLILGIFACLSAFNILIVGKKLCLYKETSPKWVKLSISIVSTIAAFALIFLIISIITPVIPYVDIIEIICEISIFSSIVLIFVERKIYKVSDKGHDMFY